MGGFSGFASGFSDGGGSKGIKKLKDKINNKKGPGGSNAAAGTDEMGGGGLGVPAMKKGGPIKKTRTYLLHKGERVVQDPTNRFATKSGDFRIFFCPSNRSF